MWHGITAQVEIWLLYFLNRWSIFSSFYTILIVYLCGLVDCKLPFRHFRIRCRSLYHLRKGQCLYVVATVSISDMKILNKVRSQFIALKYSCWDRLEVRQIFIENFLLDRKDWMILNKYFDILIIFHLNNRLSC